MKKFIYIFSIFSLLLFTTNSITATAEPKSFTQGLYSLKDMGLATASAYKIKNTSPTGRAVVLVFDENQLMQEFIRLDPNSPEYILKPLNYGSIIIIIGGGSVTFS